MGRIVVSSVRLGHANNSSSSHSILVGCSAGEEQAGGEFQFGWENFHLKDPESKARYMAMNMFLGLRDSGLVHDAALNVVRQVTGIDVPHEDGYVDHESVILMPLYAKGTPNVAFLSALYDRVVNDPSVSIAGGNDNNPADWGTAESIVGPCVLPRDSWERLACKGSGGWWTIYNATTGAKVRLSFNSSEPDPGVTEVPELVDMKVTGWCAYGCPWCYQGSTKRGEHASRPRVRALLEVLGKSGVFEVALGGGEPTAHPDFVEIIEDAAACGVTPNFTTFRLSAWNGKIADAVVRRCGSFAFSCLDLGEIAFAAGWNKRADRWDTAHPRATLQIPMGCYAKDKVVAALSAARAVGVPVTLLGYKPVGRALGHAPEDYSWVVDWLVSDKTACRVTGDADFEFGADTVFVKQMARKLQKAGVAECLTAGREGATSCYIDAVSRMMGPCSFRPEAMHAVPEDLGNLWARFPYARIS